MRASVVHLTERRIQTNPVLSLQAWVERHWDSRNPPASRQRVAERLQLWRRSQIRFSQQAVVSLQANGWLPDDVAGDDDVPAPRVVGLLFDSASGHGLVNPLVTSLSQQWQHTSVLPFTAQAVRSLLLRLCDASAGGLSAGLPETLAFSFSEQLGEYCAGNSMDVAALLSALDALTDRKNMLLSAACAVVQPGLGEALDPAGQAAAKLTAFVREYDRGTLLITSPECAESPAYEWAFDTVWKVSSLTELAVELSRLPDIAAAINRHGPLNSCAVESVLQQLTWLIDTERDLQRAARLCERVREAGFTANVPTLHRWRLQQHYADALRHAGRCRESLQVTEDMDDLLQLCRAVLSYDEQLSQVIQQSAALFDACRFLEAEQQLHPWLQQIEADGRQFSAQRRVELYNTLGRVLVMLRREGWEPLFEKSMAIQTVMDPVHVRRTQCYLLHGLLRCGRLEAAEPLLQRLLDEQDADELSRGFTRFFECELQRLRRVVWPQTLTRWPGYTCAFALQACARQPGRAASERQQLLAEAAELLGGMSNEADNVLALIESGVRLILAACTSDSSGWEAARQNLLRFMDAHGEETRQYFQPILSTWTETPCLAIGEQLLELLPYL